ncbi:MAG: pantoate--beta-alanine ligase [Acidimicrobiia bacterium]|nr:pantoate--beta-alanine ligase [Acidimicrobiia bacterium]
MEVVTTIADMRALVDSVRGASRSVGLVPTMGYLHAGHRSLVERAAAECDHVIVSVFVNPLQFGPGEDLERYPRDLAGDTATAAAGGAGTVFHPTASEMYPEGEPLTRVIVSKVTEPLCGRFRPGHFDGVTTVVAKLLAICDPDRAYFGRKDAQQLAAVTRMAADLNFRARIVACPTLREADGLAMSSRNAYMSPADRAAAPAIFAALEATAAIVVAGERETSVVEAKLSGELAGRPRLDVEYAQARDARTLAHPDTLSGEVLLAVAARCGPARLIDNVVIDLNGPRPAVDAGEIKGEP